MTKLNQYVRSRDFQIQAILFAIVFISREVFISRILYHWDSINFAFSADHFDVASAQPHVPGYILYVLFLRVVDLVFNDPGKSMTVISMLASSFAIVQMYRLGRLMFDQKTAIWASLFLATSPLFWFYGEIALPHSLDALLILITVELFYRIEKGDHNLAVPAAIWLGVVGGFRPQTELFLAPLALYAARRLSGKKLLYSGLALVISNMVWLIPLISSSGGVQEYWKVFQGFYISFNDSTAVISGGGVSGILRNLRKLGMYTLYGWGLPLLALIPVAIGYAENRSKPDQPAQFNASWLFLSFWILPSLFYYTFIHMGQQGLVFVFLPVLLLITARHFRDFSIKRPKEWAFLPAALVLSNCLLFILSPTFPLGGDAFKLLTAETIREHDRYYFDRIEAVRDNFEPDQTLILSSEWRFVEYYLPEYNFKAFDLIPRGEAGAGNPKLSESFNLSCVQSPQKSSDSTSCSVVLFDDNLNRLVVESNQVRKMQMTSGDELLIIDLSGSEWVNLSLEGILVLDHGDRS